VSTEVVIGCGITRINLVVPSSLCPLYPPWPENEAMTLRAVFFDLDDTLCDTIGCRPQRARKAFEAVCREQPQLEIDLLVSRALEEVDGPRSGRGIPAVLEAIGCAGTPTAAEVLRLFATYHEPIVLFTGVRETVERLSRTHALGVITNAPAWWNQRAKLTHLGLTRFVTYIVISGEIGYEKPDPRIFQHALALAGVRADEAVFVGDRLDVDIAGAKTAGMRAVWFNHWGGTLDPDVAQPDAVITHFAELLEALT